MRFQFHYSCGQKLKPNEDIMRENSSWDTDTPHVVPEPNPKSLWKGASTAQTTRCFTGGKSPHKSYKADEKVIRHGQESAGIDSRFRALKCVR